MLIIHKLSQGRSGYQSIIDWRYNFFGWIHCSILMPEVIWPHCTASHICMLGTVILGTTIKHFITISHCSLYIRHQHPVTLKDHVKIPLSSWCYASYPLKWFCGYMTSSYLGRASISCMHGGISSTQYRSLTWSSKNGIWPTYASTNFLNFLNQDRYSSFSFSA